jgi:tRNA(Met) C34 N-acetyltransferase TmcA
MSEDDSGFASLVEEEEPIDEIAKHLSPKIEPNAENFEPVHVTTIPEEETPEEKVAKELAKIERERYRSFSKMCYNGYHGMCTKGYQTCGCSCHRTGKVIKE